MAVIPVPKTPKNAYNPARPPGTLLRSHIEHLEWATRSAAERAGGKLETAPAKTEAEAARRIEQLTIKLHRQTAGREPIAQAAPTKPAGRVKRQSRASKPKRPRRKSR